MKEVIQVWGRAIIIVIVTLIAFVGVAALIKLTPDTAIEAVAPAGIISDYAYSEYIKDNVKVSLREISRPGMYSKDDFFTITDKDTGDTIDATVTIVEVVYTGISNDESRTLAPNAAGKYSFYNKGVYKVLATIKADGITMKRTFSIFIVSAD